MHCIEKSSPNLYKSYLFHEKSKGITWSKNEQMHQMILFHKQMEYFCKKLCCWTFWWNVCNRSKVLYRFFIAKIYRIYRLKFSVWCIKWCGSHKEKRRAGSQYPSIHLNLKYSFMYFMVNLMLLEQSNASTYLYNILSTILKEPMVCQMY